MRNRIIAAGDIYPNVIQSHYCQRRSTGWVYPYIVRLMLRAHARHPLCFPVVKPREAFSNGRVSTHVSDPNRITVCSTDTYNLPNVVLSAPSLPKIFARRPRFTRGLRRFHSTAGQSSSVDGNISPNYRNEETAFSGVPYSKKYCPI